MVSKDEALKMAIEALQTIHDENFSYLTINKLGGENNQCMVFAREAIKSCKQALNQPAQEPVAWIDDDVIVKNKWECYSKNPKPLYTHPHQVVPTSTWQRLTDDEILDLEQKYTDLLVGGGTLFHFEEFARAIEQKLKEKNNG